MITKKLKNMNETLSGMLMGIVLSGTVFQAAFVWFAENKLYFSAGLWIGVLISVFMAIHMNYSIQNAVELNEEDAPGYYRKLYAIRMGVVLAVFGAAVLLRLGSPAALFLGLFTLKIGAYLQPVLHKLFFKRRK